jgi:hypothetical protein
MVRMCDASTMGFDRRNDGGLEGHHSAQPPKRSPSRIQRLREATKQAIGRLANTQRSSLLFLAAAAVSLAIAYPSYSFAARAPEINIHGFILVLTDDPSTPLEVTAQYATAIVPNKDGGAGPREVDLVNVGDMTAKKMVLQLSLPPKAHSAKHRYLIVLGGDARLSNVGIDNGTQTLTVNRATIESRTESATADIQTYEVETTLAEIHKDPVLFGELLAPVDDTAGGTTFVRLPSLGSVRDSLSWSTLGNESLQPQEVLVSGRRWYKPKSAKYIGEFGYLLAGKSMQEARPPLDVTDLTEVAWSGEEVRLPQARISDQVAQQRFQKMIFIAGVLGGLGGGFLVEGLSRIRPGEFRRRRSNGRRKPRSLRRGRSFQRIRHDLDPHPKQRFSRTRQERPTTGQPKSDDQSGL